MGNIRQHPATFQIRLGPVGTLLRAIRWRHRRAKTLTLVSLAAIMVFTGCETGRTTGGTSSAGTSGQPAPRDTGPKRLVAAIMGQLTMLNEDTNPGATTIAGADALSGLFSSGMTAVDHQSNTVPQLAEAVPTLENGLWKMFPDGSMEMTWKINPQATWHDGTPITSADLLFTAQVVQDPELPNFARQPYLFLDGLDAVDERTVIVRWKQPFIDADTLFSRSLGQPLPKHLLEKSYLENKAAFLNVPYWTTEFIGTGPFKVREFSVGNRIVLDAYDQYLLGRPKIDQIEVRFIIDPNTLISNVLAGEVNLTMGRGIGLEQAVEVRNQWTEGQMMPRIATTFLVFPQFIGPSPAVVGDVRFRRALLHSIDRQQLADTLGAGFAPPADVFLNPDLPEYKAVENDIVRYPYDPRLAAQMIEGLGFRRSGDSFLDSENQPLAVELRTTGAEATVNTTQTVADYWRRLGVKVETVNFPAQRLQDREYVATFPGFTLFGQNNAPRYFESLQGKRARLPENNWVGVGGGTTNYARYVNPEFDGLVDRFFNTIPRQERMLIAGQLVHHITDQLIHMSLYYRIDATLMHSRLRNIYAMGDTPTLTWNAHLWEMQ